MLVDDLQSLQDELEVSVPNLLEAARFSKSTIERARAIAAKYLHDHHVLRADHKLESLELGLVAFGSLARQELSHNEETSDFDHAVVAYQAVEQPDDIQQYRLAALKVQIELRLGEPGQTRLFGGVIASSDLVNRIGLEDDTNRSHTQRLLFLEESVPIIDSSSHLTTLQAILKRYVADYREDDDVADSSKEGVPRFLLNDIVRYWRTIAVDYQAKRWDELAVPPDFLPGSIQLAGADPAPASNLPKDPKWGLRYIKLRSTRKLAFAGSLVSMYMPRILNQTVNDTLLLEQFSMPSLARLAQLRHYISDEDKPLLQNIFGLADQFMDRLNDSDFRRKVGVVRHPRSPGNNETFIEARELTQELEVALEKLFCSRKPLKADTPPLDPGGRPLSLGDLTSRYLLF
jgi:hypothetical protein